MKSIFRFIALIAVSLCLFSFSKHDEPNVVGTFGVTPGDPSEIQLTILADHTFHYQDFSNTSRKIAVSGTWTSHGNKVILHAAEKVKFHHVWVITKEGRVAKSRLGLTFYTLRRI